MSATPQNEEAGDDPGAKKPKISVGFRITPKANDLLKRLATETGLTQVNVLELAIRDLARARGVE